MQTLHLARQAKAKAKGTTALGNDTLPFVAVFALIRANWAISPLPIGGGLLG